MIVTNPLDFAWHAGPLPEPAGYDDDAMVVLAWFVWPDRSWTWAQCYLRRSHTGAMYWAMTGGAPAVPSAVRWYAVIRDQPYARFSPDDLDRIHAAVLA